MEEIEERVGTGFIDPEVLAVAVEAELAETIGAGGRTKPGRAKVQGRDESGVWFIAVRGEDDIAGGVVIGLFFLFLAAVVATAAAVFEKLLQNAVDIKSENDLTI